MKCGDRKFLARVAAFPPGDYSRHIAHHQLERGVQQTIERNERCGLKTVSVSMEDQVGLDIKKRPVSWLVAWISAK